MGAFLVVTGVFEIVIGIGLAAMPDAGAELLAGATPFEDPAAILLARIGGLGLIAIGIAALGARRDRESVALRGLLAGLLFYNVAAALLLAYGAVALATPGPMLWPATIAHAILAVWNARLLALAWRQ